MAKDDLQENEKALLSRASQGDQEAFRLLFEQYWDRIYSTALLLSKSVEFAEDVTQDVFTQLWAQRSQMAEIDKLDGFLFVLARNRIYSGMRRETLGLTYRRYVRQHTPDESFTDNIKAEFKETELRLYEAIRRMPPQQQRAFCLSRFEGLNHQEIAEKMHISQPAVKTYIVKSIAYLRKSLQQQATSFFSIFF